MNVVFLTRQELYDKVWSKPMVVLAKEFNLSDNGLRKICKKYDIPMPVMGHWQKIQNGKKTSIIKLPKRKNEDQIKITINDKKSNEASLEINLISERISSNKSLILKVSEKLSKPDAIIIKTQNNLKGKKSSDYSRIIKASADYSLSKNLTMIFYYNHSFSKPIISTSFPLTTISSGFTLRYTFGN